MTAPVQIQGETAQDYANRLQAYNIEQAATLAANTAAALNRQAKAMEDQVLAQGNLQATLLLSIKTPPPSAPVPDADYVFALLQAALKGGVAPASAVEVAKNVYLQFRSTYPKSTPAPK